MSINNQLIVRDLKLQPYATVWQKMREFTDNRTADTLDEVWLVQHLPVFTQGQAGKVEHIIAPGDIPIIQSDRGGQVTYHGPGQLILYTLLDIKRKSVPIHALISALEQSILALLASYAIPGQTRCQAPGVYVNDGKIASLGLRIRRGASYHGLSLNIAMDLEPFSRINPCGFANLRVLQMQDFHPNLSVEEVAPQLLSQLLRQLDYQEVITL